MESIWLASAGHSETKPIDFNFHSFIKNKLANKTTRINDKIDYRSYRAFKKVKLNQASTIISQKPLQGYFLNTKIQRGIHNLSNLRILKSTNPPIHRFTDLLIYWSTNPPIHRFTDLPIYRSTDLPIHRSTDLPIYRSTDLLIPLKSSPPDGSLSAISQTPFRPWHSHCLTLGWPQ